MTVETTVSRAQYGTNGTTGPWSVLFPFLRDEDLQVIYTDSDGNESELTLNVGYTVTGGGGSTGTVTTTTAYASGGYVTILRDVEPLQSSDYVDGEDFPAETVGRDFDRLMMLSQQLLEIAGRALVFSPSDTSGSTLPAAASRANLLLGFDSDGRVSLVAPVSGSAADLAANIANTSDVAKGDAGIGVKQPFTGAVDRTQHDKNIENLTAADAGLSTAATGAANVAALKKLADYAKTLGGNINFTVPPGNYTLDGTQLGAYNAAEGSSIDFFGLSNVTIQGYGATFTCTNKLGQVWFRFRNCTNVTVAGIKFIGAQTGSGGASSSGVPVYFDTAASNIVLRDLSGQYGYSLIEFQTDDLIPMGGVKYKNVTLRGIKTYGYHHAMELLHIDGLFADDISMQGAGSGNNINFRGMYLLNLSNASINGVRSFGNGQPGVGGYPIFLREYTKGGGSTLPDYNCDGVNMSDLEFIGCYCGGLELNVAAGRIRNVNILNVTITADNSNVYGGGLLEFAHDTSSPIGINNVKIGNLQITCGTTASGATGILYRHSSNTTTENTAFNQHQYSNVQVDGNACAPILTGAGGWINGLSMVNVRTSTTDLTPYITLNRVRDGSFDRFVMPDKIDLSGGRLVRVEFTNSTLGTVVNTPTDMAPVILNGESLTAATITVNASGSDDAIGSAASPVATLTEALERVSKLTGGQTAVTISLAVNATYAAFALSGVSNPINLRSPLGATVPSMTITNCSMVDVRNGLNCAGGVSLRNSNAHLESLTLAGAGNGINALGSRVTSVSNNFTGTTVGIKALAQSQIWSTGDTGTASTYGYSIGEASVCYKEASSTLTGTTAQKQLVSAALVNF